MGIDRLLKQEELNEQERRLLVNVKAVTGSAEKSAVKIPELRLLQEKGKQFSARRKLFYETAAQVGKNSLCEAVGRYLFVKGDSQFYKRILLPEKNMEKCCCHILKRAEEMAMKGNRNALCVADDVVFGWAVDYFCADNIKDADLKAEGSGRQKKEEGAKGSLKKGKTQGAKPPAASLSEDENRQLSLFDICQG